MGGAKIDTKLLKSKMVLHGVSTKAFAKAQNWSQTTVSRKINGKVAFTAPEIQVCVKLLNLSSDTASKIFFAEKMS